METNKHIFSTPPPIQRYLLNLPTHPLRDTSFFWICGSYPYNIIDVAYLWPLPNLPIHNDIKNHIALWNVWNPLEVSAYVGKSFPEPWIMCTLVTLFFIVLPIQYVRGKLKVFLSHFHPLGGETGLGEFIGISTDASEAGTLSGRVYAIMKGEAPSALKVLENHPLMTHVDHRDTYTVKFGELSNDLVVESEGKFGGN